ncbi:MAG: DNA-3-methyladenine glycosylase 2 family protein [Lachnospiraceae bacterium]|nr:DNA-3-methyladenine glycosylase 2 family protein [Lachnospiraceae bacterium]
MRIQQKNDDLILQNVKDFNIEHILECGQCFNFEKIDNMEYIVVAYEKMLHIKQEEDTVILFNTSLDDYECVWKHYFDMDVDYETIKQFLKQNDEKIVPAIEDKWGIRILNQEFNETLISFIISQNKQIPHIKKIVRDISRKFGNELGEYEGNTYYSFPDLQVLQNASEDDFRQLKTGFRAPYIMDAICKMSEGLSRDTFDALSYEEAVKEMLKIKGVGEKVANCVALFSLGYRNAFPVDVWVKRVMEDTYFGKETSKEEIMKFAKLKFGEYGGYAQQYHFYHMRDKKNRNL